MAGQKKIRTRGKIQFSRYFQELKIGDKVAIVKEKAVTSNFPLRLQGRTGNVEEKRGKAYLINLMDHNQEKRFLVEPIHLKKIK